MAAFDTPTLLEAEKELEQYFTDATALGAQVYDAGAHGVWDDARIHRAHIALRRPAHRAQLRDRARVELVLWQLDVDTRHTLEIGFAPFGAARVDWKTWNAFRRGKGHLLALAIESRALRVAYGRDAQRANATRAQLLAFLDRAVLAGASVVRVVEESLRRRDDAVAAYEVGRVARNEREKSERAAHVERVRARMRTESGGGETR